MKKTKKSALNYFIKFYGVYIDAMGATHSMARTGYKIPGITIELFMKTWTPEIRKTYDIFIDHSDISNLNKKDLHVEAYISLTYIVTHILYTFCDFSLFRLKKEPYEAEYDFLIKAAKVTQQVGDNDIGGEIVDCLILMGGESDPQVLELIHETQYFLYNTQTRDGAWKMDGKIHIHAIHTAVTGLIDHTYATEGPKDYLELVSFQTFKERLNSDGLMMKKYDYFDKELNALDDVKNETKSEGTPHDEL